MKLFNGDSNKSITEIIENQTVYYLANNILDEKDNINYKISIKPEDENEAYELLFTRQYY